MNPFARLVPSRRAPRGPSGGGVSPDCVELTARDLPPLLAPLRADAAPHAWVLAALEARLRLLGARSGPRWFTWSPRGSDQPAIVVALGRNVHLARLGLTSEDTPSALAALTRLLLRERLRPAPAALAPASGALVGPSDLIDPLLGHLWPSFGATPPRPPVPSQGIATCTLLPGAGGLTLVDRGPQVLMAAQREHLTRSARSPELAPSEASDIPELILADRAMVTEELGRDAFSDTPLDIRDMWLTRLEDRRSWLVRDTDRKVLFKADVAAMSQDVAQIAGVYTRPGARGRGLAFRGVGELSQWLLRRVPVVCLAVYADNHGAVRLYERLGFRPVGTVRALWLL